LVTIFLYVSIAPNCFTASPSQQNRREKIFNRGLYVCSGGVDILKFDKIPPIYSAS